MYTQLEKMYFILKNQTNQHIMRRNFAAAGRLVASATRTLA
jgi:hypothetical protein